jgi:hypothetical protein
MSYQAEIFVSYRRSPTVGTWVQEFLVPLLDARLNENSPSNVQLFVDVTTPVGARWPNHLKSKIKGSKILLPIWSADYFRSPWCMAEWESFRAREALLDREGELIYPLAYTANTYFHPDAQATQAVDFSTLAFTGDAFRGTPEWLKFDQLVTKSAIEIVARLQNSPPWHAAFPIVEPAPMPIAVMERVRL